MTFQLSGRPAIALMSAINAISSSVKVADAEAMNSSVVPAC